MSKYDDDGVLDFLAKKREYEERAFMASLKPTTRWVVRVVRVFGYLCVLAMIVLFVVCVAALFGGCDFQPYVDQAEQQCQKYVDTGVAECQKYADQAAAQCAADKSALQAELAAAVAAVESKCGAVADGGTD